MARPAAEPVSLSVIQPSVSQTVTQRSVSQSHTQRSVRQSLSHPLFTYARTCLDRGASIIRNSAPLVPYTLSAPLVPYTLNVPRALRRPEGGGLFIESEVAL